MHESFALMGVFLNITHPNLYQARRQVYEKIVEDTAVVKEGDAVLGVLQDWTSPFSGYGLISNCTTPLHWDNNSQGAWYDLLTTIGPYSQSTLLLKNLGLELQYNSGTMVALLGKLVRHGTTEVEGNRICIAQYMRDNVHEHLGIKSPGWMHIDMYNLITK
jgi:hypothetical protein